jgi:hypothetical protein
VTKVELRESVTAMVRLVAAAEEGALLGQEPSDQKRPGSALAWALSALVAHNTEFKAQQVVRLKAVRDGNTPPKFVEIDHASAEEYRRFSDSASGQVLMESRSTSTELIDLLWEVPEADLTDPGRLPWLNARPLWLQTVVRGFWHPGGHLGEYWLSRRLEERALRLHGSGVALAEALDLPDPARGMAHYALACARARTGNLPGALAEVVQATALNPALAQSAGRDPDLEPVRALPGWQLQTE